MTTTGKISSKRYRCVHCGHESTMTTNHWGEVYSRCAGCSWKRPGEGDRHECLDPMPEGFTNPAVAPEWTEYWTLDEAAECMNGLQDTTIAELWQVFTQHCCDHQYEERGQACSCGMMMSETPPEVDSAERTDAGLHTHWSKLSEAARADLLRAV